MKFNLSKALEERYGKPHLSYSSIKQAMDDMAKFDAYMRGDIEYKSDALDFGTMYDMLLFDRKKAMTTYRILDNGYILERCSLKTQEAKSPSMTNEFKEVKAAIVSEMTERGEIVCNPEDWDMANKMVERLSEAGIIEKYFSGEYQKPVYKDIEGVLVKGFIDCRGEDFIMDSKSTRSVSGFRYDVNGLCYDVQAYLYTQSEGINKFYWVAQEKTFPYLPAVVTCSEETLFRGEMKFRGAIKRITDFLQNGEDPRKDYIEYEV